MKLIIIAALNKNRVIGRDGKIPWHVPEDLQRFKQLTTHHTVLMGRKTFDSIGKPLPNRRNVVISRNQHLTINSVEIFPSIISALSILKNEEKIFIIGGGEIFEQTMKLADELALTIMDNNESGDTFFPSYEYLLGNLFFIASEEQQNGLKLLRLKRNESERKK